MFKNLWAFLTGDSVGISSFGTGSDAPRYLYGKEMIAQINRNRRFHILSNNAQTEIYVVDTLYRQRVGRLYDISYALVVADALNANVAGEE